MTSRPLTTYHSRNHLTRRYGYEKLVWGGSRYAFILPGTKKPKGRTIGRINAANDEGETEIVRRGRYTMVVYN
jgi:hypothetical protein